MTVTSVMTDMPIAEGALRLLPKAEGVCVCPRYWRDEVEELLCWCSGFVGPAVQGLCNGELGEAFTGRKNC